MSAAAVAAETAGPGPTSRQVNEVLEYEKIIKLRDAIFAGSHPRLTIPAILVRKVSPLAAQTPALSQSSLPPNTKPPPPAVKLPGLQLTTTVETIPPAAPFSNGLPPVTRSNFQPPAAAEIDPIFLTKSDVVVRAELQLQRQRLERNLREQLDRKKNDARHKASLYEAKPDFDVADVLSKALEIVKPVAFDGLQGSNDNASTSDSFDENSFYSSRAPDSTPRTGRPSPLNKPQELHTEVEDQDTDELVDQRADGARQSDLTDSPYKVNPRRPMLEMMQSGPTQPYANGQHSGRKDQSDLAAVNLDEDDEPEYSPPEPVEHVPPRPHYPGESSFIEEPERSYERQGSGHTRGGPRYGSPTDGDARMVRNHMSPYVFTCVSFG